MNLSINSIRYINIALEIFGSALCLILIICLFISKNYKTNPEHLFIAMLVCNMVILTCDAITWLVYGNPKPHAIVINYISNFILFCLSYVGLFVFTKYLITFIGIKAEISKKYLHVAFIFCLIAIALVIVSQFNGMYYTIDEYNIYNRQDLFWLSQMFGVVGMAINLSICIRYRKKLLKRDLVFFTLYIVFPIIAMILQVIIDGLAFLNLGMTLSMLFIYFGIQVEQAHKRETALAEGRVVTMLSQIQPHFLYNTLSAIGMLCYEDEKAHKAIITFSEYLRGNMDTISQRELITFEKELEHVKNYVWLEELRFEEKVQVEYDIQTENFMLPALTIQPIIENAVRYGLTKKRGGGTIILKTEEKKNSFRITITDDGIGFNTGIPENDEKKHIGISTVEARLKNMCKGTMKITSTPGKGTVAVIDIPKYNSADSAKSQNADF